MPKAVWSHLNGLDGFFATRWTCIRTVAAAATDLPVIHDISRSVKHTRHLAAILATCDATSRR